MKNDMTYSELALIKSNISTFVEKIHEISKELGNELNQEDKEFFRFISKHIIFFKYLYGGMGETYFFKVIISDFYNYIFSIIKNETRYIYLNERSIIENYTRAVVRKTVEEDYVTINLFETMKSIEFLFDFKDDDYCLIKDEYKTSCGYIHGSDILNDSLVFVLEEYLDSKNTIKHMNRYYDRIRKILKVYDKMLISQYSESISGCFHRKKTILEYLLGNECLEILFKA
ncbi:MAG: hypothetical protein ACRDD7_12550 [Peptostreptococcaceae bacterium]